MGGFEQTEHRNCPNLQKSQHVASLIAWGPLSGRNRRNHHNRMGCDDESVLL